MAENSAIAWTRHTLNYWVGCTKISPACDHCYAEAWAKRSGSPELWQGKRRKTKTAGDLKKFDTEARLADRTDLVFSNSLSDFFDNQAEPEWRDDAWGRIRATTNLIHLLLTKRPQNISGMLPADWGAGYKNVWLGVTAEDQERYDQRRLHLLKVPAVVHFYSVEPMLSPIIRDLANEEGKNVWYICGGESGSKRRPFDLRWAEDLRASCANTETPFFFKQDAAMKPGQRGRASDALWACKQFPRSA